MNASSTARRAAVAASVGPCRPSPSTTRSSTGLEAAIDLPRRSTVRADVEPLPGEMRLQRPQPRSATAGGEHDLPDLRRGPLPPLALERERELELEKLGRCARHDNARLGNERLEPTMTVRAQPPVQRAPRDSDEPDRTPFIGPPAVRAGGWWVTAG